MSGYTWREIWRCDEGATYYDPVRDELHLQLKGTFMPIEVVLSLSDRDEKGVVEKDEEIREFLLEWGATGELLNRTVEHWRKAVD